MVDVHDGLPKDGFAVPLRLHNVLLALAGRLDDSALSEARELVARSHLDDAAELAVGALISGRIMVRPAEQRELALVLEMSRSDATLADQLTVGDAIPGYAHRFSRENEPERGISEALDRTLQVLPDLRSVHAVWRNTPAGSVPGPLPQRVVLVEIGPEAHPPAVAFRVDDALRKGGIRSVVEVTGPGAERTEYHEAALAAATPVWLATGQSAGGSASWSARGPRPVGGAHTVAEAPTPREPSHAAPDFEEPAVKVSTEEKDTGEAPEKEPEPTPAERENRAAATTEMTKEEVAQLRAAIAEDPEKGRAIAAVNLRSDEIVELPELDLDDPQLSDRDRQLLRELHAELAERERAEAAKSAKSRTNGSEHRWADGFSGG
ncbi:hypothetical protein DI005_03760 [Prauserella sp. PE36]|uniref:DUF222 domain-containing protein n=1 Tax=Prauserella endophytica TaxID=1592324 RepID=A0ABY2S356_9PSEU|nr:MULTISPECIES: hypothetical protein [Prauserella]PXY34319.1 hypothetical protein BAY59_01910 [Prauserella coralliicola]RBM23083.1 hypothetical protein DI005_03760 [Prauserella sp. PE36]TKG69991.1 hypothetical protein FCN18_17925 [Prauserella endophytica]